jgi:hypothetical protein
MKREIARDWLDHSRIPRLEGRLLLSNLGALQEILEQALVDGRGSLEFAQADGNRIVDIGLAGRFAQGFLKRCDTGLRQVVFAPDAAGQSFRLRLDGAVDIALLRPQVDHQRMRSVVTCQQFGLLL